MFNKIRLAIAGKKTYLTSIAAIITALVAWSQNGIGTLELVKTVFAAVATMTMRAGISKAANLTQIANPGATDLLDSNRPADASTPSNFNLKTPPQAMGLLLVGLLVGSMAYGDAQPATPTPGFGDTTLAAAKLVGAYIATNGSQSVSSGFSGFGSGKVVIAPVLSQSLTLASFGRVGANTLTFGVEHATSFQPNANRECLGLDANLHVWKNGKIGRILVFNFADCGLATGIDAPVEWFNGQHIRGSQLILQVGVFAHF